MAHTIEGKPSIEYPCQWIYKIIGFCNQSIRQAVETCLKNHPYTLSESNKSQSGKYISMSLVTEVSDETFRDQVYTSLKNNPEIKMVL